MIQSVSDFFLIIVGILNMLMGLFILSRKQNKVHVTFFLFCFGVGMWVLANSFIDHSHTQTEAMAWSRITAFINSFLPSLFLYFVIFFPTQGKFYKKWYLYFSLLISLIFSVLSIKGNSIVQGVDLSQYPVFIQHGYLFPLYGAYLVLFLLFSLALMIYKFIKSSGIERTQTLYLIIGSSVMIIVSLFTNLILPLFHISSSYVRIGPASTVLFVGFTTYAILCYRFMDIYIVIRKTIMYTVGFFVSIGLFFAVIVEIQKILESKASFQSVTSLFLFVITIFNILFGLLIYFKSRESKFSIFLFYYAFCIALWSFSLFLFTQTDGILAIFWMKSSYVSAILIAISLWYFSFYFPVKQKMKGHWILIGSALLIVIALYIPNFLTKQLTYHSWGKGVVLGIWEYILFSLYFLPLYFVSCVRILMQAKNVKKTLSIQASHVALCTMICGVLGVFCNLILPSPFFENHQYIWLGPVFTLLNIICIFYIIFRYRFLNIEIIVRKTIIYGSSLFFALVFFFYGLSFVERNIGSELGSKSFLPYIMALAFLLVIVFDRLKKGIRMFVDRYWPYGDINLSQMFSKIEENPADMHEADKTLPDLAKSILKEFNVETCGFIIKNIQAKKEQMYFAPKGFYLTQEQYDNLWSRLEQRKAAVVVTEQLNSERSKDIRAKLEKWKISAVVRIDQSGVHTGLIVLGARIGNKKWKDRDFEKLYTFQRNMTSAITSVLCYDLTMDDMKVLQKRMMKQQQAENQETQ